MEQKKHALNKNNKKSANLQADLNEQITSLILGNQETFLGMKQPNLWKIMKKRFLAFKQMQFLNTCKFQRENMIVPSSIHDWTATRVWPS